MVSHHGAYGHLRTRAGSGGHRDHRQGLARHHQEFDKQGFGVQMGEPYAGGDHLAGVHHRAAAEGYHTLGLALSGRLAPRINQRNVGFRVDVGEQGAPHPGLVQ